MIVPALVAILLAAGCGEAPAPSSLEEAEKLPLVSVEEKEELPKIESFGSLVYSSKVDVYAAVEGRVETVHVEEGDVLAPGDLLASLEVENLLLARERADSALATREADLRLAQARLQEGRREVEARLYRLKMAEAEIEMRRTEYKDLARIYDNKKQLFLVGGVPAGELEAVETRLVSAGIALRMAEIELKRQSVGFRPEDLLKGGIEIPADQACSLDNEDFVSLLITLNTQTLEAERTAAEAELQAAQTDLRRSLLQLAERELRSPMKGVLSRRGVEPGETAHREGALFSIFSVDPLHVMVEIGEKDLPRVFPGMEAEVRVESLPPLRGFVKRIAPYVNPSTKSAELRIQISNPEGRLRPGMFARTLIITGPPVRRLQIPASALMEERTGGFSVQLLRNSRIFRTPVKSPGPEEGYAYIEEGLSPGDLVLRRASPSLRDGTLVEALK